MRRNNTCTVDLNEMNGKWKYLKLKDVVDDFIVPMRDKPKVFDGSIPWCRIEDIEGKFLNDSLSDQYVSEKVINEMNLKVHPKGTVICSCSARLGVCAILTKEIVTNQTFIGLVPSKKLNKEFLYYSMTFNEQRLQSLSSGTTIAYLSRKEFENFYINVPSLVEQEKIVRILSTWDLAIENQKQLIEKKKELKKGLMQRLLNAEVRFKEFNDKWKKVSLGNIFDRITQKNEMGCSNVLTISAQNGLINQEDFFNKSVSSKDLSGYYLLKKGDFAYNKSYSNGYPLGAIKRLNKYDEGVVSPLYICFRAKEKINTCFYEQYFESGFLNKEIFKIAQEGARNHGLLNVSVTEFFKDIKLVKPSLEEQEKIAKVLVDADKEIELLQKELEALKLQKKGLMQRLLTGEVRVKV